MALPTHRLDIFKRLGAEEWANSWLLNAASMDAAQEVAEAIVSFEQHIHSTTVTLAYYRLSTTTVGDRTFRHVPLNLAGLSDLGGVDGLPLFNTLRVDLSTLDSDPCRKYFRIPLTESMQANGLLSPTTVSNFQATITTYLLNTVAIDNIVSNKGNVATGATVYPFVQMRQLKRKKRKKVV